MTYTAKSHDVFTTELHKLKITEQGAIATSSQRHRRRPAHSPQRWFSTWTIKDWVRLRTSALDNGCEAAHAAVVKLLCQPVELVP